MQHIFLTLKGLFHTPGLMVYFVFVQEWEIAFKI